MKVLIVFDSVFGNTGKVAHTIGETIATSLVTQGQVETLLVGDYLFDLLCAKAAGAVAILLANHSKAEEFIEHADFCIKNISEILEIIKNKNKV